MSFKSSLQTKHLVTTESLHEYSRTGLPATLPSITSIMNNSFHTGTFARAWKIAEVIPIPKSGNSEDPCNNRTIGSWSIC